MNATHLYLLYFINDSNCYRIDASLEDGSYGRLINDDHIEYNAQCKKIIVNNTAHVAFFATRNIKVGEEVTYKYSNSPHYWWRQSPQLEKTTAAEPATTVEPTTTVEPATTVELTQRRRLKRKQISDNINGDTDSGDSDSGKYASIN